jgi:hypothetical protein
MQCCDVVSSRLSSNLLEEESSAGGVNFQFVNTTKKQNQ